MKEKDIPLIYVTSISTLLVYFNFFTIYSFFVYNGFFKDIIPGKYYVLIPIGIIWILNYFVFVRKKEFLDNNFKKDANGGMLIILYILFTAASFIVIANYNRDKIFKQRHQQVVISKLKY
ncbi:hypothetical protein HQN84_20700 [Pedobacter steynii]|nr:hypothetical protein [Pedobacter steynii]NQX41282.1 hypothetical protein [Pedobacter steynii]